MEYYRILNLAREPFSNSPEPEFFYESPHHVDCLQKLELAIRIRRGLNVVIGDVGTGKTTLSRQLIQKFAKDGETETHLMLDPHFSTEREFLLTVAEMFGLVGGDDAAASDWQLREQVKKFLFEEAVEKSRVVVLIIDEGQKIPDFCLEILREFLNYETNEYKLLQIVIFAQEEFREVLERHPGFADRINLTYDLGPLSFRDTRSMVLFRIERAMERGKENTVYFTRPAMREIYRATGGYPRKIVKLCHQILLTLIIQNRTRVGRAVVRSVAKRVSTGGVATNSSWAKVTVLAGLILILLLVAFEKGYLNHMLPGGTVAHSVPMTEKKITAKITAPRHPVVAHSTVEQTVKGQMPEKAAMPEPMPSNEVQLGTNENTFSREDTTVIEGAAIAAVPVHGGITVNAVTEKPERQSTYPAILGQVKVKKDKIVWRMIEEIYGGCDVRMLRLVAAANPHIKSLDRVVAGDIVNFPSISATSSAIGPQGTYRVQIKTTANLEAAYNTFRTYSRKLLPLEILSHWTEEEGLQIAVLLKKQFTDKASAQRAIESLPPAIAAAGTVISGWKVGTVFFVAET